MAEETTGQFWTEMFKLLLGVKSIRSSRSLIRDLNQNTVLYILIGMNSFMKNIYTTESPATDDLMAKKNR